MKQIIRALVFFVIASQSAWAQTPCLVEYDDGLPDATPARAAFADFDADGQFDLVACVGEGLATTLRFYHNAGGVFTDTGFSQQGPESASFAWGDYDADGLLDLVVTGVITSTPTTTLYRNTGTTFEVVAAGLVDVMDAAADFGDYDGDGDVDLAIAGQAAGFTFPLHVYENAGGTFVDTGQSIPGAMHGDLGWADYDADGDLDLAVVGLNSSGFGGWIYENQDGTFVDSGISIAGTAFAALDWGDFDLDGDPDLAVSGQTATESYSTRIYRNDGGAFVELPGPFPGFREGDVAWGDQDGDGDLDLAVSGLAAAGGAVILEYEAGTFIDSGITLPSRSGGTTDWADVDLDGDLDLLLTSTASGNGYFSIHANGCAVPNTVPAAPGAITSIATRDSVRVVWSPGSDGQTPEAALTYAVWATDSDGNELFRGSLNANLSTGSRTLSGPGNNGPRRGITWPKDGGYIAQIGVQTVDSFGSGSAFTSATLDSSTWLCVIPDERFGSIPTTAEGGVGFADFDLDGDQDLALVSRDEVLVFGNAPGGWSLVAQARYSDERIKWFDWDGDGDPDLSSANGVLENTGAGFVEIDFGIAMPTLGRHWSDVDQDGDLDFVYGHTFGPDRHIVIQSNLGGSLGAAQDILGVAGYSWAFADYDGDGDRDMLVAGVGVMPPSTDVVGALWYFSNEDGVFVGPQWNIPLPGLGVVGAGDSDNDGDPDFAVAARLGSGPSAQLWVYENDGGTFAEPGVSVALDQLPASLTWRDVDGDGRRDIVGGPGCLVRNLPAGFQLYEPFPAEGAVDLDFADLDGDGVLELFATGPNAGFWTMDGCNEPNSPPTPPSNLRAARTRDLTTFSWDAATDAETAVAGLSYELVVGTTPGGSDVHVGSICDFDDQMTVAAEGNKSTRLSWSAPLDYMAQYYWSVRTVDSGWSVSECASLEPCADQDVIRDDDVAFHGFAWADYDNDGDWDFVQPAGANLAVLEKNVGGTFERQTIVGDSVQSELHSDWADFDGDGDLDLAVDWGPWGTTSRGAVFRNDGGTLVDTGYVLPAMCQTRPRWGDVDNDGDVDLLIIGSRFRSGGSHWPLVKLMRNDGGVLGPQERIAGGRNVEWVPAYRFDAANLFDYDQDGDLDLLILWNYSAPTIPEGGPFSVLLRNDGGTFVSVDNPLGNGHNMWPAVDWGDVDGDGVPEMALVGQRQLPDAPGRGLFNVVGGAFTKVRELEGRFLSPLGDWNGDGYPELLSNVGFQWFEQVPAALKVFDLQNGEQTDLMVEAPEHGVTWDGAFLDFDGDDRLDYVAVGEFYEASPSHSAVVYNRCTPANTPPAPPTGLQIVRNGDQVTFSWDPGLDAETPSPGLNYNLMVGSSIGGTDIMPPHSDPQTGRRLLSEPGNVGWRTSWTLTIPAETSFYWGVQSIDAGLNGSPFAVMSSDGIPTATEPTVRTVRPGIRSVRPNPFNPSTTIEYVLDREQQLRIEVFDARGSRVVMLRDEVAAVGEGAVEWNGRDARGRPVAGGVYFVRLRGETVDDVRKIALVK